MLVTLHSFWHHNTEIAHIAALSFVLHRVWIVAISAISAFANDAHFLLLLSIKGFTLSHFVEMLLKGHSDFFIFFKMCKNCVFGVLDVSDNRQASIPVRVLD